MTLTLLSCTEKEIKLPEFELTDSERVVLLEELTGVRCPNCPSGGAKIEELLDLYHGKLIVMAVHGEFDAEPLAESAYDFRSEEAKELEHYLSPFWGKPAAAINRIPDNNGNIGIIGIDTWGGFIEAEFQKAHHIELFVETEFNQENRKLTIHVNTLPLVDLEGNFNISVAITESHIIDAQLNQSTIIPDYEHNHVFRKMLTDVKGDLLTTSLVKNELIEKSYEYTLPEDPNLWVPENCHVVAFISKVEGESKDVLQAAQANVVE
jgi:hypothetical protein